MKTFVFIMIALVMVSCKTTPTQEAATSSDPVTTSTGQANVVDNESMKDVVKVAVGSPDHSTLVAALKQADLVNALANAGPFTVFAPTNAAFDKLPAGTVDGLMNPDKKGDLQDILQYHVTTSALKSSFFKDGMTLGMVDGSNITFQVKDGKVMINNSATIIASVPASNGIVHVIDAVLLPPAK